MYSCQVQFIPEVIKKVVHFRQLAFILISQSDISFQPSIPEPYFSPRNRVKKGSGDENEMQARNKNTAFISDVRVGAEPLSVLANERQLSDLQRFCSNVNKFQPLTVNPTFNIREFNVTPISYQNFLMHTKQEKKHLTIIGPTT